MITAKSHHRKPDPLLLLAAAVLVCAVVTTAATADDVLSFRPASAQVRPPPLPTESGFMLASVGQDGGSVSVSLMPPYPVAQISPGEQEPIQKQETLSQVFLLLRYPW